MRSNEKYSKEIDTGQMETRNSDKTNESSRTSKELKKTDENQMSNRLKMNQVKNDKKADRYTDQMDNIKKIEQEESENRQKDESESEVTDMEEDNESVKGKELYNECKGLLIEIEFDIKIDQQKCELVIIQHTIELVKNWKEKQVISGVQGVKEAKKQSLTILINGYVCLELLKRK